MDLMACSTRERNPLKFISTLIPFSTFVQAKRDFTKANRFLLRRFASRTPDVRSDLLTTYGFAVNLLTGSDFLNLYSIASSARFSVHFTGYP